LATTGGDAALAAGHRLWAAAGRPDHGRAARRAVVTGVDDHSRFCVLARIVERATSRAVCVAFSQALERYGAPEEVLTDNGKQFTDRFGRGGEVLLDKICRRNAITHRLTNPGPRPRPGRWSAFT
jgi:transposase InsO family protein